MKEKVEILFLNEKQQIVTNPEPKCIGVIIKCKKDAFLIEKYGELNPEYSSPYSFSWGNYGKECKAVQSIDSIATKRVGLLPNSVNGLYAFNGYIYHYVGNNPSLWDDEILLQNNGKMETTKMPRGASLYRHQAYVNLASLVDFINKTPMANSGFNDWYIPTARQLSLIFINLEPVNDALETICCNPIGGGAYWSCSQRDKNEAWYVDMKYGIIAAEDKKNPANVRLVRDIDL